MKGSDQKWQEMTWNAVCRVPCAVINLVPGLLLLLLLLISLQPRKAKDVNHGTLLRYLIATDSFRLVRPRKINIKNCRSTKSSLLIWWRSVPGKNSLWLTPPSASGRLPSWPKVLSTISDALVALHHTFGACSASHHLWLVHWYSHSHIENLAQSWFSSGNYRLRYKLWWLPGPSVHPTY